MEDQSLFNSSQPKTISEGLQNFIDSMVEEIVLEGKPFDTQKKYLKKFSENEGLDYEKLEADITTFIEILDSLKTAFSKLQVKLAEEKGKECHVSEEMVKKLVSHSSPKNQEEKPEPVVIKESGQVKTDDPDKPKKKKAWPWIIGIGAAAVALLVMFLKPVRTDPDTQAYEACQTLADYRDYCANYGLQAVHYAEAQQLIDSLIADSIQRAKTEALALAKQEEENAYQLCTTIEGCDAYLEKYPQGPHLEEVQTKRDELVPKTGSFNGHEWVDLGLPSGTLWATCNVGASKPEDYGSYFAWGETKTKTNYFWDTYKHANGSSHKLTKYCNYSGCGDNGFTDKLTTLQTSDDPATANWSSGWRTPSWAQWDELLKYTNNEWTTQNGKKGRLFTAKNGQTLFLPAAGYRFSTSLNRDGNYGYYWSRSLCSSSIGYSWYLIFSSSCRMDYGDDRESGFSVRPVREK